MRISLPKSTLDLGNVYEQNTVRDETYGRVFGRKQDPNYITENKDKYARRNLYQEPVVGKRHEFNEKEHIEMIKQELEEKEKEFIEAQNQRQLNTTYNNEYVKKNIGVNVVGRKVMRDQDGSSLAPVTRDQDLLVDNGLLKRGPLADERDLQTAVKKESYVQAQPYTFWAEKAKDGAYYNSKQTGEVAPFSRNNEFLKTYNNYSHTKN